MIQNCIFLYKMGFVLKKNVNLQEKEDEENKLLSVSISRFIYK